MTPAAILLVLVGVPTAAALLAGRKGVFVQVCMWLTAALLVIAAGPFYVGLPQ